MTIPIQRLRKLLAKSPYPRWEAVIYTPQSASALCDAPCAICVNDAGPRMVQFGRGELMHGDDMELIVAMRNELPAILDALTAAQAKVERLSKPYGYLPNATELTAQIDDMRVRAERAEKLYADLQFNGAETATLAELTMCQMERAEAIAEREAALAKVKGLEASRWIACADRMPPADASLLLHHVHWGVVEGSPYFDMGKKIYQWDSEDRLVPLKDISHWRPLPPPPTNKDQP